MRTVFRPEWLIDGVATEAAVGQAVLVRDGVVEGVTRAAAVEMRPDDRVEDLPHATLMPGLINNHVHLVLPGDNTPFVPWVDLQSDASLALLAAHNAASSLRAGVTTIRDCGGRGRVVLDVRNAQSAGRVPGARVISCGWPLTITGGHTRQFGGEADGADGLRRMVRRVVSQGADFVKVMASGGGTPGSLPHYPSFSVEELRVVVAEAHALGRPVAMHCIATASIAHAVAAGADLIEHASFFGPDLLPHDDPQVREALASAGIPVTPTLQVARDLVDLLPDGAERSLWQGRQEAQRQIVARLHAMGVPLLAGSDAGWRATAFDTFWKELDELVACGLKPGEAVRAATGAVSDALGGGDRFGTIRPGRVADFAAVAGDLARDIGCLRQVVAIYQAGEPVPGVRREAPGDQHVSR